MTPPPSNSRQVQKHFDEAWTECERMTGRPLNSDEIESLAEEVVPEC